MSQPRGFCWVLVCTLPFVLSACDASGPSTPTDATAPAVDRIPAFEQGTDVSTPGPAAAVSRAERRRATATIPVADGWTLLSVPLDSTASIGTAFPTCTSAFVYAPGQGYQSVPEGEPLPPGRGAFLNCTADTASVSGPVPDPSISLSEGWNLIGPHAQAVAAGNLSTDPGGLLETSFYGFEGGGGYATADTLRPGHGYWVKTGGPGTLLLPGEQTITYAIQGDVTSSDGDNVSGNTINVVNPADDTVATTTTTNASYSVNVTEDELGGDTATVHSDPAGYDPYAEQDTLSEGTNTHDITLQEILRDYAFTINDDQGNPVDSATVDIDEATSGDRDVTTLTTDANGDASTTLSVDEDILSSDTLEVTVSKSGYQDLTFTDVVDNEAESFTKSLTPADNVDRVTITFNPKTVGNSLYSGGSYSGSLDYTVTTPDTSFTATGSTTADVPIGDGDDLTITHSDAEYISTFAVNNTDTEQPPFQVSGFPAEPDYQGTDSVSIDKSELVNQYQIRAIPSTSPGGYDTQTEYSGELFEGRWHTRGGQNDLLGIVTTTRIDNQDDVPQSVIDKMNNAFDAAKNQMSFLPITIEEHTWSEVQDIYNNRGVNFNYSGIDGSSPTNILNTSNGYAERGRSTYAENESSLVIKNEIYESLLGIDNLQNNYSDDDGNFNAEAKFIPKVIYSLDSQSGF